MANMENLLSAPPAKRSRNPKRLPEVKRLSITDESTPGTGMDPETEDDKHQEGEKNAIFEFFICKKVC